MTLPRQATRAVAAFPYAQLPAQPRTALDEHGGLRLTPQEVLQIERALDSHAQASPELTALIRSVRVAHQSPD